MKPDVESVSPTAVTRCSAGLMDNIFIRTDPAGNIKADKEKSTEKIDGAVAIHHGA